MHIEITHHDQVLVTAPVVRSRLTYGWRRYYLCPLCRRRCRYLYVESWLVACRLCGLKHERPTASERRLWQEIGAATGMNKTELRKMFAEYGSYAASGMLAAMGKTPL